MIKHMMRRTICITLSAISLISLCLPVSAAEKKAEKKDQTISAPSAILMETSTGQVIYEKDPDSKRPPASVTKVMTLLLIFDAINEGKIKLEDEVTTSEYAASMGGSQVFLEPGETQTVDTLIKCISVASANDACVSFKNSRHLPCMDFGTYRKY